MTKNPLAGKPATPELLINVPKLLAAYYTETPDPKSPKSVYILDAPSP